MTGEPGTTTATTAAQHAEDRVDGGPSRLMAQLLAPVVAIFPWLTTFAGATLLAYATVRMQERFEQQWGLVFGGLVVLVVAALLWAALAAWSSSGALVAGVCTIAVGVLLATRGWSRFLWEVTGDGPVTLQRPLLTVITPFNFFLVGSLLLAVGLGAAGARRLGRRRH